MIKFEDLQTTRKGAIGERLVIEYLEKRGIIVYQAVTTGNHPFDFLCLSRKTNTFFALEVKTKARRNNYPDTGINIRHYDKYLEISKQLGLRVFIVFIDEMLGCAYGDYLDELSKDTTIKFKGRLLKYPIKTEGIIYFYQPSMKQLFNLTEYDKQSIIAHQTRNYSYTCK